MAGIAITRLELTAAELRAAAGRTKDARAARARCWRLRWCWKARIGRRRPRPAGWTARRCATGCIAPMPRALPGLRIARFRSAPGGWHPTRWRSLRPLVEAGPDLARDGVVRWRCRDLQRRIAAAFGVALHECRVGKQLAALGFRRYSVRPQAPKSNPQAQVAFKKTSPKRSRR